MTVKQKHVRVDKKLYEYLSEIKEEVGVPITETARRALWWYLVYQGRVSKDEAPIEIDFDSRPVA